MLGFSFGEIFFLLILALIVIGPKQLPEVARSIARLINEFKRASESVTSEIKRQAKVDFDVRELNKSIREPIPRAETTHNTSPSNLVNADQNIQISEIQALSAQPPLEAESSQNSKGSNHG